VTLLMISLTCISLTGLLAISIYKFLKSKNRKIVIFQILVILSCFWRRYLPSPIIFIPLLAALQNANIDF